jgi:delta 1-pyrroline-5-carboxylate dehydrogenase
MLHSNVLVYIFLTVFMHISFSICSHSVQDELLHLANDSEFGLCSSVWSRDAAKARRIASKLHVGMSNINDYGVNYLVQSLPFGGVKLSGYGRFGGVEGLRECCAMKSITTDATSLITTAAMMPPVLDYPIGATSVAFHEGLMHMTYGAGIIQRVKGLAALLGSLMFTGKSEVVPSNNKTKVTEGSSTCTTAKKKKKSRSKTPTKKKVTTKKKSARTNTPTRSSRRKK